VTSAISFINIISLHLLLLNDKDSFLKNFALKIFESKHKP